MFELEDQNLSLDKLNLKYLGAICYELNYVLKNVYSNLTLCTMKVSSLRNRVSAGVSKMRGRVEWGPIAGVLVRGDEDPQRGRGRRRRGCHVLMDAEISMGL